MQRSALSKPGKFFELLQIAQEATSYFNKNYPEITLQLFLEIFGDVGKIYWVSEFETLDTFMELNTKTMADQGYISIVNKATDLVVDGGFKDTLMRSL